MLQIIDARLEAANGICCHLGEGLNIVSVLMM